MATSGNYRNYREVDGRKIAHTIDPRTGYPVNHSLLSATVIADDCATAPDRDAQRAEGIAIARESLAAIRDRVAGVQVSAPFGNVNLALEVIR